MSEGLPGQPDVPTLWPKCPLGLPANAETEGPYRRSLLPPMVVLDSGTQKNSKRLLLRTRLVAASFNMRPH